MGGLVYWFTYTVFDLLAFGTLPETIINLSVVLFTSVADTIDKVGYLDSRHDRWLCCKHLNFCKLLLMTNQLPFFGAMMMQFFFHIHSSGISTT